MTRMSLYRSLQEVRICGAVVVPPKSRGILKTPKTLLSSSCFTKCILLSRSQLPIRLNIHQSSDIIHLFISILAFPSRSYALPVSMSRNHWANKSSGREDQEYFNCLKTRKLQKYDQSSLYPSHISIQMKCSWCRGNQDSPGNVYQSLNPHLALASRRQLIECSVVQTSKSLPVVLECLKGKRYSQEEFLDIDFFVSWNVVQNNTFFFFKYTKQQGAIRFTHLDGDTVWWKGILLF